MKKKILCIIYAMFKIEFYLLFFYHFCSLFCNQNVYVLLFACNLFSFFMLMYLSLVKFCVKFQAVCSDLPKVFLLLPLQQQQQQLQSCKTRGLKQLKVSVTMTSFLFFILCEIKMLPVPAGSSHTIYTRFGAASLFKIIICEMLN